MRKKAVKAKKKTVTRSRKPKKMLKKETRIFKELLLELKKDIIEQIRHISAGTFSQSQKEAAGDISSHTIHMADVATDSYDREFSLELASNDRALLYQIDDSLKRIEDGNFGICGECSKPISKTRLKAIPYTGLCLKCQKSFESK